jgi:hypothetical protein
MEEILASIKRVIADEEALPPRTPRGRTKVQEEDVLELSNPVSEEDALVSADAAEASRVRLAALAAVQQSETAAQPSDAPLEAIVREMLKPMLKEWLDQRLPEMVEEMVAREIARITGKPV